jgi:hypothetical protein
MKTFVGAGDKLNPNSSITREEAFTVLSRAFKLSAKEDNVLDKFSDKNLISDWAIESVSSLISAGYVAGSNGQLNPKQFITRAEFAQVMYNLIKNYVNESGTYTTDYKGNVMVNEPDVTLKNLTVKGDLIIGDGVGNGTVTLDSVTVTGRTVLRGGGENSIRIIGNSNIQNIIIARVDGVVRVYSEDGTEIGEVIVDGSDDVIIEGTFGTVTLLASNVTVTATDATIESATVDGEDSKIVVEENSTINTITVTGQGTTIEGKGKVESVEANANDVTVNTPGTSVTAGEGATGVTVGGNPVQSGETVIDDTPVPEGGIGIGTGGGSSYRAVSSISVDQENQLLEKHLTLQLTTTISPANATNKTVAWSSSDETVATVDNSGMVTAVGKGTATITATTVDGNKTDTITITVPIVVENAPSLKIAIQQEADDGDAIVLRAGKYELDETLVITKSIKILGPQANVDPRPSTNSSRTDDNNEAVLTGDNGVPTPETKEEAITAGWLDKLFVIKADNVVIDGLTFDRAYYSLIQSDKKSNNEYTTGLRIENNIVRHGRGNEGIKIGNSVNPLIQKNYIYDILTPGDAIEAINNKGFRILDNDIEEVNSVNGALRLQNLAGGEPGIVRGNVIKDTGNHFAITINSSTGDVIIDDNTITNTKAGGIFAYKNKSNSEDDCSNIKITNNTIDNYGVSPAEYPDYPYKENYIKNGASAIFVSYNLEAGSQPIVEISGNTTKNGASGIPVLCFGGGTLDSAAIPTDLSKIIVFNNIFDKLFVKYINVKSENEFDLIDNTWPEIEAQKVHNLMKGSVYDTIQAAIADAADGDTILIASGTYVVNQTIQTDKELTIIGNGTEKTIIDVSSVPDNAWGVLINKSNSTIKDLTI